MNKDKLVTSEVKPISNKRAKMTPATDRSKEKGQTAEKKKTFFDNLLENEIIQDEKKN